MTAADFLKKKEFVFSNIYYLIGEEEFMYDKIKKSIIGKLGCSDLNVTYFGQSVSLTEVINEANQAPFFEKYRLILLNNPSFLKPKKEDDSNNPDKDDKDNASGNADSEAITKSGKSKAKKEKTEADFFAEYLKEELPQTTVIILKHSADKRSAFFKTVGKISCLIELNIPEGSEFIKWIIQTAKNKGLGIDNNQARLIADICGSDMLVLDNEIEKLSMLGKESVTDDDIKRTLSATDEYKVFNVHDFMIKGQYEEAFKLARNIFADEKSYIPLTAILYNKFRLMLAAKEMLASGKSEGSVKSELTSKLKAADYAALLAVKESKKFKIKQLNEALKILSDYDAAQKSGGANPGIEYILMKIYN